MTEEREVEAAAERVGLNVSTIEGGNVIAGQPELLKGAEYFENALTATGYGKFNYITILISGLILANVLLETLGMSYVLAVSQCDLHLTTQERGVMSAIGFAGIISSSHLWGFLADTTGRRKIIRPTLLVGFFITVLSSFSTNFWTLVILRYINGFCISAGSAAIYAYLGEFHTKKNRSTAIMGAAFIFGVGAMIMPAIAWLVINQSWRIKIGVIGLVYKPWRLFMIVCGIPGFLCGLALFKIPESPKFVLSRGEQEKALDILQEIYRINTGKPKNSYPVAHVVEDLDTSMRPKIRNNNRLNPAIALIRSMWQQTQPLFNNELRGTTMLICTIQFWIFVTSNGMYMWFPQILNHIVEYSEHFPNNRSTICQIVYLKQAEYEAESIVYHLMHKNETVPEPFETCVEKLEISTYQHSLILEMFYAVGFAVIGIIISKVDKMLILFICLTICGACGVLIMFIDIPIASIYLYLILLLCGLGINVLSASTVDLYPTRLRAMAVCISLMMGRLGSVVGANIVGLLINDYCEIAFVASGLTLMISGVLGFFIPKATRVRKNDAGSPRRTSLISMTGN